VAIRRNRFIACLAALGLSASVGIALVANPVSAAGGATTTLHYYSVTQSLTATSATGQPVGQTDVFPVGTHFDGTDLLYAGQHQRHTQSFSGSDHLQCVVNVASTVADRQTCTEQFAFGSAMLLATNVTVTFNGRTGTIPINGGTGKYKNARGTLVSTPIANSNNYDNTFSLTGVGSGPTAVPLSAGTTLPFYTVQQSLRFTSAAGKPLPNVDATTVGDSYDSTDLYYAGTKQHHSSSFSASDHLACTYTSTNIQTCNNQIAIGGSLLLLNNVLEPSSGGPTVSAPINAGTGTYQNVSGRWETGVNTVASQVTITLNQ
jgi:hypothetical protein